MLRRNKNRKKLILLAVLVGVLGLLAGAGLWIRAYVPKDGSLGDVKPAELTVEGIPVVEYCNSTPGKRPLIVLSHGMTGNRNSFATAAAALAKMGFFVVTPDNWGHGDRGGDGTPMAEAIVKTAEDFDTLIAHYAQDDRVDTQHIGLIGFSMGGLADFYYAAYGNVKPELIGTICATPDWSTLTGSVALEQTVTAGKGTAFTTDAQRQASDQYLLEHDPYDKLVSGSGMDFYMINGGEDPLIPVDGAQALYNALQPQGRATLIVDPEKGHDVSVQNLSKLMEYFRDHLLVADDAQ